MQSSSHTYRVSAVNAPLRVWHPLVHSRYQEGLYFYAIEFDMNSRAETMIAAASVLAAVPEAKYLCRYPVYGVADAVVRVWANEQTHKRILHSFQAAIRDGRIRGVAHMHVTGIAYPWSNVEGDLLLPNREFAEALSSADAEIKEAVHRGVVDRGEVPPDIKRFLIERPPALSDGVGFFVTASPTGRRAHGTTELDAVALSDQLHALGLAETASVYVGYGPLGALIVKGRVENYEALGEWTEQFDSALTEFRLRSTTMLIAPAGVDTVESDNINSFGNPFPNTQDTADFLGLDSPHELDSLDSDQLARLNDLVGSANSAVRDWPEGRSTLTSLLVAAYSADQSALWASLSFLLKLELQLRGAIVEALQLHWGMKQWVQRLGKLLADAAHEEAEREAAVAKVRNFRRWTLGDGRDIAESAARLDEKARLALAARLGARWESDLHVASELRNDYAHGRLVSELADSSALTERPEEFEKLIRLLVWSKNLEEWELRGESEPWRPLDG